MIKAKELRLGNIVAEKSGFMMFVTAIFENSVYLDFEGNEGDIWEAEEKELKPIPLTEEILLKAGFYKHSELVGWDWFSKGGVAIKMCPLKNGSFIPVYYNGDGYMFIEHVHQFQNLIFALKRKELKLTIKDLK